MRTVEQLLAEFQEDIETLTLILGDGGAFEVIVDGDLIYSKLEIGRHAEDGEVAGLVRERKG